MADRRNIGDVCFVRFNGLGVAKSRLGSGESTCTPEGLGFSVYGLYRFAR